MNKPRGRVFAVRAPALGAEAVKRRQHAGPGDPEDRPTSSVADVTGTATERCPIEVPVDSLDEPSGGACAVRAIRKAALGAEVIKRRQLATWGHLEGRPPVIVAAVRGPVEVPIGGLD